MSDVPPPPPPPPGGLTPPPGYVGYGTAPTPLAPVRPIAGLSRAVAIVVAVAGVASALRAVVTPAISDSATEYLAGQKSEDEFLRSVAPLSLFLVLTLAATLAAGILTMIWMYRISVNVRTYGRATFWAPLWAIFGWFLPPILFVIPLLMLRELWKASTPEGLTDPDGWKRQPENPALLGWWALFGLIPTVLLVLRPEEAFSGGVGGDTDSLAEALRDSDALTVAAGMLQLAAAVAWVLFVRQMARRHTSLTGK